MSDHILAALRSGQAAEALSLAEAQLAEQPELAENHYWKALALQSLGRKDEAVLAIDAAIALAPERGDFPMTRSVMLLGSGDATQAQSGLMDALALNPNYLPAYVGLIHIALGQKNFAEAGRLLRLAERVDSEDADVLIAHGSLLQAQGDADGALAKFTQAGERNPDSVLAMTSLGFAYLQKRLPAFAQQALQRAKTLAPASPALLRALTQCHLLQDQFTEAEAVVDELLALRPEDFGARALRSQLRADRGELISAIADAEALVAAAPTDLEAMTHLCMLYARSGDLDAPRALIASAIAAQPTRDALWQLKLNLESAIGGDSAAIIADWLAQMPDSALAHESLAVHREQIGDLAGAAQSADRALALNEALTMAQFVKLRQEVREAPQAALLRLAVLKEHARAAAAQRMVSSWTGLANDRLGNYAAAGTAFSEMAAIPDRDRGPPAFEARRGEADADTRGRLLWAPPGVRLDRIFMALLPLLGERLLLDRHQPGPAREDGFGFEAAASTTIGSALTWKVGIQANGLSPEAVVDWLPHWDAGTAAALDGTVLTAIVIDPRDALLNWMVFGCEQSYVFHPKILLSAQWLAAAYQAVLDSRAHNPQSVNLVAIDALDTDAAAMAEALKQGLALDVVPDAAMLAHAPMALGGLPRQFPSGHWRHYRDSFSAAFDLLTPVAVAMGYPQD
jgi:tetratricopeptide (TPR) repeat protein